MANWLSHASFVGHLGKYGQKISDPLAWIGGDKWTHLTSDVLPEKVNAGLSAVMKPFEKVDKTINPVRRIPIVNRIGDIVASKPGDALAIAAGAFFGGAAALGGGGAAGAGGAGGAGGLGAEGGALGTTSGFGGVGADAAATGVAPGELAGAYTGAEGGLGGSAAGDFTFNAAQDSQAANVENGLQPVTTDDTLANIKPDSASTNYQAQQQQQRRQQRPLDQLPVYRAPTYDELAARFTVPSSRTLKTKPGFVSMHALADAGATGKDQISQNGVHIGAIRALHTEISRLEEIARRRGIKV